MTNELDAWYEALQAFPISKLHSLTLLFHVAGNPREFWNGTSFWGMTIVSGGFD
jgi:hypothetical protein